MALEAPKEMFKILSNQRNSNQNDPDFTPIRMAKIKISGDSTCWKGWEKEEHSSIAGGIANW